MSVGFAGPQLEGSTPKFQSPAAAKKALIIDSGHGAPVRPCRDAEREWAAVRQFSEHLLDSFSGEGKVRAMSSYAICGKDPGKGAADVFDRWRALTLYAKKNPVDYILSIGTSQHKIACRFQLAVFYNSVPRHAETMHSPLAAYMRANGHMLDGKCGEQETGNPEHSLLRVPLLSAKPAHYPGLRIESDFASLADRFGHFVSIVVDSLYKILEIR